MGSCFSPGMKNTARGATGRNSFAAGDATVILGKTGEPAQAFGGFDGGKHDCQSAYVSPEDRSNTSTGSAVAVAAGFGAAALDHDGAGSSIIPAGRNALFALRPTRGLVSRRGIIGYSDTDYTIVSMSKSAYDIALLLEIMAGTDLNDPLSRSH
jgi:Asp-tRNA(Asn)/Glu-tRNA(Gln) amidotransferase A subunit family amidase